MMIRPMSDSNTAPAIFSVFFMVERVNRFAKVTIFPDSRLRRLRSFDFERPGRFVVEGDVHRDDLFW